VIDQVGVVAREVGDPATETDIVEAERALGVSFPRSYAGFLSEYGWADIGTREVYGLGRHLPVYQRVVDMTLEERSPENGARIPRHLVVIFNDGGGNLHCLDTSRMIDEESPVVFWDHDMGPDQEPDEWSANFVEWLAEAMELEAE
jgi:hypothetical protein